MTRVSKIDQNFGLLKKFSKQLIPESSLPEERLTFKLLRDGVNRNRT